MLDLSEHSVVDSHCHPFLPEKETDSFEQDLTIAFHPIPKEDMENTFLYRQTVRELSRVLGVKGTHRQVVEERQRQYRQDPVEYTKLLFEDARIDTLLVDTGYPSEEFSGYSIDLKDFSKIVHCELKEIFRIDNVAYNLLKERTPYDVSVEQFHEQLRNAVKNGAVGLKSVIAYRTGLEIKRSTEDVAREAYGKILDDISSGSAPRNVLSARNREVKTVFDQFVLLSVEESVNLDVPFQMHVGMGDAPFIDLRLANPILLHDFINDLSGKDAKIVLTHGGYPWIEEAGFLVNTYPNVFLDLSETIPFISIGIKNKLLNLFEMAPTNKLMYGSDGYNLPELHWISSILTKRALENALNPLVESKEIDEEWAQEIAVGFLSENTMRIYNL